MASKPDDDAIKARILKHLNSEHQDSLVLYLEHYLQLSSFSARNARLTSVDHSALTISASGATHVVPFPHGPLASLSELRPAVVAMDQEARTALGRSAVTVKTFVWPGLLGSLFALWVLHNAVTMWDPSHYRPGSWMYEHVYGYWPWYASVCERNAWWVWWAIFGGHLAEWPMWLPMLRRHNVPVGSGLWCGWLLSQFVLDGIFTIKRFEGLVRREEERKAKASH